LELGETEAVRIRRRQDRGRTGGSMKVCPPRSSEFFIVWRQDRPCDGCWVCAPQNGPVAVGLLRSAAARAAAPRHT